MDTSRNDPTRTDTRSDTTRMETARVCEIFSDALETWGPLREKFLERACGRDAGLRAAVDALLAAHGRAGEFLADPTLPGEVPHAPAGADAPLRIGPYTLVRVIGEGGCGTVYLAEQGEPLPRRVAVKVIKPGMDSRQVIARFDLERQALAMMEHPNIARVFDAGATDLGRPYFVMELVDGPPITEYCRANRLSVTQRLELFASVCSAVQHAHQKGIIHRDIKPSNVLVGLRDGLPVPKVIDFGIAKALFASADASAGFSEAAITLGAITQEAQLLGTPQYMSPEQARGEPGAVDTRSDIYSLGVLLYEVLTDAPPFERARLRSAAYAEVQRIISEVEPPAPSSRLATLVQSLPPDQPERRTEVRRVAEQVRGDLDWIVMRAMEKDPARRYATAEALAADIARHLSGAPVEAGPVTRVYRLRKFARRNRWLLGAAAAVAAALLIGMAGTTAGLLRARTERDAARAARQAAEAQRAAALASEAKARRSEAAAQASEASARSSEAAARSSEAAAKEQADKLWVAGLFLHRMLAPTAPPDNIPPPRDVLDLADLRANDGFLKGHPETEAPIRAALALAYLQYGDWETAERQYRLALDNRRQLPPGKDYDEASYEDSIGLCLMYQGKYELAEPFLRKSLDYYSHVPVDEATVIVEQNLAAVRAARGDFNEPLTLLEDARRLYRKFAPGTDPDILRQISSLAGEREKAGDPAAANLRKAEAELRQKLGGTSKPMHQVE